MIDFDRFELLSFDCYGTLIDWEAGILRALEPLRARHQVGIADDDLLRLVGELESAAERGPWRPYAEVLRDVVAGLGRRLGFPPDDEERSILASSIRHWRPFPDTVGALRALRTRYRLAIISNVDDDLFAATAAHLEVAFDHVVTAQQVRAYKPSEKNFREALARFRLPESRVLHVAQSLYHDIGTASRLGLATVHIDRRRGRTGSGLTPPASARADLELADLASLARMAGLKPA